MTPLFENFQPPLSPVTKSDRGFEHNVTGSLLCPIDYDWSDEGCDSFFRYAHHPLMECIFH